MTLMNEDYKPYTDRFGLVQPEPGDPAGTSGNGLLYTAQAVVAYHDNDELTYPKMLLFEEAFMACEKEPGLMNRAPEGKDDQEGPDDYVGCGLMSSYADDGSLARRILAYGNKRCSTFDPAAEDESKRFWSRIVYYVLRVLNFGRGIRYVYNNSNPGKFTLSAWLGRQPGLIAHLKIAAGIKPTILERLVWCVSLLGIPDKTHHDSWILSWCRVRSWRKRGLPEKLAVWWWSRNFKKVWGNPGDLLADYFKNPSHPNAVYLKGSD